MRKNSTIDMLSHFLKYESSKELKDESCLKKNISNPKEKTINTILAYAKSVKCIRIKESVKGIISLN